MVWLNPDSSGVSWLGLGKVAMTDGAYGRLITTSGDTSTWESVDHGRGLKN
jgi:hypothetical protein